MNHLLPPSLVRILEETTALREAYLVGGCVRDYLLNIPNHDFDIEVFGVSMADLADALRPWGRIDLVGRAFGVIKLSCGDGGAFDFTLPRRDSKVGPGHKGFHIEFDPEITPRAAAARRDFTINALMWDPRRQELIDAFGGAGDLSKRILRHTSPAFVEDPLRVLRGMQLVARFNLNPARETVELCRGIKARYSELAVERVRDEWLKWAAKSTRPSAGLRFLAETQWIEHFPELNALRGTPQDPEWHPEGDVFVHTCHCCDAMVQIEEWKEADPDSRVVLLLATLAHDLAKPVTTAEAVRDGRMRIVSPGHEAAGGPVAEQFLRRIHMPGSILERVVPLVTNHMAHLRPITERSVRRLARRLEPETIARLCLVMSADHMGRPPKPAVVPESARLLMEKAFELQLQDQAPKPILLGRHLIERGWTPGPHFGEMLARAFDAQIEGAFFDLPGALEWLEQEGREG